MKLEKCAFSEADTDRIIGWQAPRITWPGTVSRLGCSVKANPSLLENHNLFVKNRPN